MPEQLKQELKEKLARTRLQFRTMLTRLNEQQWNTDVYHDDETWTVLQLVRHLVDSEQGLITSIERIRDGGEGVPPDFDLKRWNSHRQKKMADKGPKDLLVEMAQHRARLLEVIEGLKEGDWGKEGRHASLRIMSIEGFVHQIADHEAGHSADIARAVGLTME